MQRVIVSLTVTDKVCLGETYAKLQKAYGDECMKRTTGSWMFPKQSKIVDIVEHCGRCPNTRTEKNITDVFSAVGGQRRFAIHDTLLDLPISQLYRFWYGRRVGHVCIKTAFQLTKQPLGFQLNRISLTASKMMNYFEKVAQASGQVSLRFLLTFETNSLLNLLHHNHYDDYTLHTFLQRSDVNWGEGQLES